MAVFDLGHVLSNPLLLLQNLHGQGIEAGPALGAHRIPDGINLQLVALVFPCQGPELVDVEQLLEALKVEHLTAGLQLIEPCQGPVVPLEVVELVEGFLARREFFAGAPVITTFIKLHGLLEDGGLKEIDRLHLRTLDPVAVQTLRGGLVLDLGGTGGRDPHFHDVVLLAHRLGVADEGQSIRGGKPNHGDKQEDDAENQFIHGFIQLSVQ